MKLEHIFLETSSLRKKIARNFPFMLRDPKKFSVDWAYSQALEKGSRWKKGEKLIKKEPEFCYKYAKNVLKQRWPEAEDIIIQDLDYAFYYAKDVIKSRWKELEEKILKTDYHPYGWQYARDIIKSRWPELEEKIKDIPEDAYNYALYVIKGRWPEAEPFIKKSMFFRDYEENVLKGN